MKIKRTHLGLILLSMVLLLSSGCNNGPGPGPEIAPTPEVWGGVNKSGEIETTLFDGTTVERSYTAETVESSPNAKGVTQITWNVDSDFDLRDPHHHPILNQIIYLENDYSDDRDSSKNFSILWRLDVGAKKRTKITHGDWLDREAKFTNDGDNIIFSSVRSNLNSGIWSIKSSGLGGILKLTEHSLSMLSYPSMGKGNNIVFQADDVYRYDHPYIWTMTNDGSFPTQLRYGLKPDLSPNGETILFLRKDEHSGKNQIFTCNMNGGEITQLTFNIDYDCDDPSWSYDGNYIVYASNESPEDNIDDRDFNIWVMDYDAMDKVQLTTNGSHDDQPIFSPDGKYIYFRSSRGGSWNIWRFQPVF